MTFEAFVRLKGEWLRYGVTVPEIVLDKHGYQELWSAVVPWIADFGPVEYGEPFKLHGITVKLRKEPRKVTLEAPLLRTGPSVAQPYGYCSFYPSSPQLLDWAVTPNDPCALHKIVRITIEEICPE